MTRAEISQIFPEASAEQIDRIMAINGSDINGIRGELTAVNGQFAEAERRIAELEAADQSAALQEAQANVSQLQSELDALRAADRVRQIRETVAAAHKVPVNLLTGETEEACTEQAKNILAFAKPGSYPNVQDGGSPAGGNGGTAREQFAKWAEQTMNQ